MILVRWLYRLYAEERLAFAWIVAWSVASTALLIAQPLVWRAVIDAVRTEPGRIPALAGWMVGLGLAQVAAYALLQGARSWTNARLSHLLRRALVRHLARVAPEDLERWTPGDLLTRLHDDCGDKVSWLLCSGVFRAFEAMLVLVTATAAIAWVSPSLAPVALAPLPLLLLAQLLAQGRLVARSTEVQAAIARSNEEISTTFAAVRVVLAAGLVRSRTERFAAASAAQREAEVRLALTQQAVQVLFGSGWTLALVGLVGFGGAQVVSGELSLGSWIAVEGWLAALVWPMFDLGILLSRAPHAAAALTRVEAVLAAPEAARSPEGAGEPGIAARDLVVERAGRRVVDGVALTVGPGEHVAVAGAIGAGKTSLLQALVGQRTPRAGSVARSGDVGYVPQDPSILSVSLADNVALGRAVDVRRAADTAQLDLDALGGPDVRAGDRGARLSGGQQQRLAIARALAGNPAILVADDATSALDPETEARLWDAIRARHPDLAVVLATHRADVLARADRVIWLEQGRVTATGTHRALLEHPRYAAAYGA